MLAQRASWFRLFPMRAIWRVRSRSTARADAVHVRVRAMASRSNAEGETPAAVAFARQAACSAGVTRAATITVRCSDGRLGHKSMWRMSLHWCTPTTDHPRNHPLRAG